LSSDYDDFNFSSKVSKPSQINELKEIELSGTMFDAVPEDMFFSLD